MKNKWEFIDSFLPIGIRKGRLEKKKKEYTKKGYDLKTTTSQKYGVVKLWGRKQR
jgi:hypothetical protein